MSAIVVAFLNFKGGVGKTANVVNLAAALAATHQQRVLVVDLDAQCNSSLWLLGKPLFKEHTSDPARSVAQAFRDAQRGTKLFRFDQAVVRGVPRSEKDFKLIAGLDLLPASIDLLEVEEHLAHRPPEGVYRVLHACLKPRLADYDWILIDCAPNFFSLTKNAVFTARHLVIPYIPDFLSLVGFQSLARLVEGFGARVGGQKTALGRTRISALIVNRYVQNGNVYKQGLLELEKLTGDLKAQGLIHPDTRVLQPPVRQCVKVAEAPALHRPIALHAPESIGGQDYAALADDFRRHFEEVQ